jgi:S1-C subfamily serine protease
MGFPLLPMQLISRKRRLRQKSHPGSRKRSNRYDVLGMILLVALSIAWGIRPAASAEPLGFAQDCSGFARAPLLGTLRSGRPEAENAFTSLAPMAPRLSLEGRALATYARQQGQQPVATLEEIFGVSSRGQREIVETTFYQEARAVVLYPNILATVAHALTLDSVEVQVGRGTSVRTVPLHVTQMALMVHVSPSHEGVPAHVAHINEPYDLALIQSSANDILLPLPYAPALSYGRGNPRRPTGGLQAGDCVATVVASGGNAQPDARQDRLITGKVLARVPVAVNSMTQTKLNINMFTTDLAVKPGDSGSPVLALQAGKPVLVGLVSATMYPTAAFTYVSRIDPLLALADALHSAGPTPQPQRLVPYRDKARLAGK